jgi:hypothetical protein
MAIFAGQALPYVPPSAPVGQQIAAINRIIDRLNDMLSQIVLSDGTNTRLFLGYQKDGWGPGQDFGMKVSLPGVDVLKATDAQLLFKMALDKWTWRNASGQLIQEFDIGSGKTNYYNPSDGKNFMRTGILPDGQGGWAVMAPGVNVDEGF